MELQEFYKLIDKRIKDGKGFYVSVYKDVFLNEGEFELIDDFLEIFYDEKLEALISKINIGDWDGIHINFNVSNIDYYSLYSYVNKINDNVKTLPCLIQYENLFGLGMFVLTYSNVPPFKRVIEFGFTDFIKIPKIFINPLLSEVSFKCNFSIDSSIFFELILSYTNGLMFKSPFVENTVYEVSEEEFKTNVIGNYFLYSVDSVLNGKPHNELYKTALEGIENMLRAS